MRLSPRPARAPWRRAAAPREGGPSGVQPRASAHQVRSSRAQSRGRRTASLPRAEPPCRWPKVLGARRSRSCDPTAPRASARGRPRGPRRASATAVPARGPLRPLAGDGSRGPGRCSGRRPLGSPPGRTGRRGGSAGRRGVHLHRRAAGSVPRHLHGQVEPAGLPEAVPPVPAARAVVLPAG